MTYLTGFQSSLKVIILPGGQFGEEGSVPLPSTACDKPTAHPIYPV
jgi:hypothetical protein